ncbi:hypothetical protein EF847_01040 [Actinobacteria bacterium YIM 96077]|uniref:Uncharacterized protein n=2 Tax=Phytoactinopolyspora halophila TaxID=1981511 RepID=A0A329R053_9ACTN|nr:hypothetical protein EF847_01040 [Actinobacteria bacterium YIM 96077]RAW18000.1 hypothetical protein DPM12_03965 [Phytoactinopolyspora halophila]
MVVSSFCGVYADEGRQDCLCHYDYERGKDTYPEAHLQVYGTSPALKSMTKASGVRRVAGLEKLHFPVGGRRYRPTLEDIVEFLIVEKFATGRDGWEQVVQENRDRFLEIQLRAAIRRRPDVAHQVLNELPAAES